MPISKIIGMNMKLVKKWCNPIALGLLVISSQASHAEFKRFSASVGWLHVMPQGNANPLRVNTGVEEGRSSRVGLISGDTIRENIDESKTPTLSKNDKDVYNTITQPAIGGLPLYDYTLNSFLKGFGNNPQALRDALTKLTGTADIYGLSAWNSNAGLEVEDVDTVGLMVDYYVNENVSLQFMGGVPPEVDLKGKGQVYAPFSATGHPLGPNNNLYLKNDILITDLDKYDTAASARAWTPALQALYHFGKPGVNKLRPFIGAGVMAAHYTDIEVGNGVEKDLIAAGHMIQNIYDGEAGAALEGRVSSGDMQVKATANNAIAPILTLGFNYDFKENWYATASISYAKLNNKTDITVTNRNTGEELIHASTKIDVDPIITYAGIGYRF